MPYFYVRLHCFLFGKNSILSTWKEHRGGVTSAGQWVLKMLYEKKLNEHWKVNVSETGLLPIIGYLDNKKTQRKKQENICRDYKLAQRNIYLMEYNLLLKPKVFTFNDFIVLIYNMRSAHFFSLSCHPLFFSVYLHFVL